MDEYREDTIGYRLRAAYRHGKALRVARRRARRVQKRFALPRDFWPRRFSDWVSVALLFLKTVLLFLLVLGGHISPLEVVKVWLLG